MSAAVAELAADWADLSAAVAELAADCADLPASVAAVSARSTDLLISTSLSFTVFAASLASSIDFLDSAFNL